MQSLTEGQLTFSFPNGLQTAKLDDWSFYRNQFLHLEQPSNPSKLFPRAIDRADVLQRLKQLVRSVDPHPQVLEIAHAGSLPWSVS